MKLRFVSLVTVFCLAIALLGCGGGGGGSSPVAPPLDANFDLVLQEKYPTLAASYIKLDKLLMDGTQTPELRVQSFMLEISDSFTNAAGAAAKSDLETQTLSRLKRYNINKYSFNPATHTVNLDGTISVTTDMSIDVAKKPEAETGILQLTTTIVPKPVITWINENGTWRILKGLPYLASEVGGMS